MNSHSQVILRVLAIAAKASKAAVIDPSVWDVFRSALAPEVLALQQQARKGALAQADEEILRGVGGNIAVYQSNAHRFEEPQAEESWGGVLR